MMTVERKYRMIRVTAGDYILPSNDRQSIYRIAKYEDGPSHGIEGMSRDQWFWGVWLWEGRGNPDPDWDDRWSLLADWFPTRQKAIDYALGATA